MGLAASQARFLCITARKADCEYRSTELAQQKLDITKQLSDISNQYAQAMNATKLVWSHEGLAADCTMNYGLMMLPSAANDFNPYMITSPSGAIVLNTAYAAAARAAGISKAGGVGSQDSRDKFIAALAYQGLVTEPTADAIMMNDYKVDAEKTKEAGSIQFTGGASGASGITWNPGAGLGAPPLDKGGNVSVVTLAELTLSESIGQQVVDWALLGITDPEKQMTKLQYETEKDRLNKLVRDVNTDKPITEDILKELQRIRNEKYDKYSDNGKNDLEEEQNTELKALDKLIEDAKRYYTLNDEAKTATKTKVSDYIKARYDAHCDTKNIGGTTIEKSIVLMGDNDVLPSTIDAGININSNKLSSAFSIVQNGLINHDKSELEQMTIGDIINQNIVLITHANLEVFQKRVVTLLDSIVEKLGYSADKDMYGQGLYVDDASKQALQFAYDMVIKTYLDTKEAITTGSSNSDKSMIDNSAYANAVAYNRLADSAGYQAVSLTNMLSSFLTYYENALNGGVSNYVVGKALNTTSYVTDDPSYSYVMQVSNDVVTAVDEKSADFYDQLYNNILEHGWREDSAIDDSEYLESMLKDGRYSMSSLNQDGYYYQTRYNETGYIVEVSDTDAIERAEAEFISMKAQLTFKEDSIDIKTKKLDAEISALSTEYETVKGLISKCIEKTFAMFSN